MGSGHRVAHITPWRASGNEIKFVLSHRADYEWMRDVIRARELDRRVKTLLASTVFGALSAKQLVAWVLEDGLPVRVQLQMHKYIWPPDTIGV